MSFLGLGKPKQVKVVPRKKPYDTYEALEAAVNPGTPQPVYVQPPAPAQTAPAPPAPVPQAAPAPQPAPAQTAPEPQAAPPNLDGLKAAELEKLYASWQEAAEMAVAWQQQADKIAGRILFLSQ